MLTNICLSNFEYLIFCLKGYQQHSNTAEYFVDRHISSELSTYAFDHFERLSTLLPQALN